MIAPIYYLLFGQASTSFETDTKRRSLDLTEDQVNIKYTTYKTNNPDDMQTIIDQKLAPGKTVATICTKCEHTARFRNKTPFRMKSAARGLIPVPNCTYMYVNFSRHGHTR